MSIVTDAGRPTAQPVDPKRVRYLEVARLLRAAKTDEEATLAVEALVELSRD